MIVSVHQPQYLPWLGFFDKIEKSDCFVYLDRVQYKSREFQNRNKIRTKDGWIWLTVPVMTKGKRGQSISEIKIDNELDWRKQHFLSLKTWYARAKFVDKYISSFEEVFSKDWEGLSDLNVYIINYILKQLAISTPVYFESKLGINNTKTGRIIEICKKLNADTYLSGAGGKDYLDEGKFIEAGIKLVYQDYPHPAYEQCYSPFIPYMSIIDLLFNKGEESLKVLKGK